MASSSDQTKMTIPLHFRSICLDDDDRSAGFVSIQPRSGDGRCRANLGFALIPEYWNQGVTTRAITEGWKLFPEVAKLEAMADVDNNGCHRVMEKLGFHKEGVLRKHTVINDKLLDCSKDMNGFPGENRSRIGLRKLLSSFKSSPP